MDWDDARYFLAVARSAQMLGAAKKLGVSQALLSRRIASLEATVGARLFDRTTRGCTLTEQGSVMYQAAERIESEMLQAMARLGGTSDAVSGTVRIGAPDGFGSLFLAPRLKALHAAYPGLNIQLVPMPRSFSLSRREADLAVTIGQPEKGRLKARRLTDYTLRLYASRDYLERHGRPSSPEELAAHTRIGYVDDLLYTPELQYASEFDGNWHSDIEISTAVGQLMAVRSGAGIGILHDFMAVGEPDLEPVMPEIHARRSYWMVRHEDMHALRRIDVVADFLEKAVRNERALFTP